MNNPVGFGRRLHLGKPSDEGFSQDDPDTRHASPESEEFQSPERSGRPKGRSLLARGIGYLSRREYSQFELRSKLAPYAETEDELEQTLTRLQKENWQSDSRFLQTTAHANAKKWGASRIAAKLRQHQLQDEAVNAVLGDLRETEYERAKFVWEKKFKGQHYTTPAEYNKQCRFLLSRGFAADIVRRIVRAGGPDLDEE